MASSAWAAKEWGTFGVSATTQTIKPEASPSGDDRSGSGGRYWLMALGKQSKHWDSSYAAGIAFIDWDELGDLRKYKTRERIKKRIRGLYDTEATNDSLACYEFCHVMKPGDTIVVKQGSKLVLGHGIVRSDYRFDDERPEGKHVRDVAWLSKRDGVKIRKKKLPQKTLTDITKDPDLVAAAKHAFKIDSDPLPPPPSSDPPPDSLEDAHQDLFLSADEIDRLIALLKRKKNLVLKGPPGTGKTYGSAASRVAAGWRAVDGPHRDRSVPPVLRIRGLRSRVPAHRDRRFRPAGRTVYAFL